MSEIGCRVMCTADIHVGRVSSRRGDDDRHAHACAAVVERLVDAAIQQRVDVVAIAGDVVDKDNRFFEAFGPLLGGFSRLASENIDVVAVSGNHDWDVLPRLAAQLPRERFHLLGCDGRWETRTLARNGRPILNVVGRCFTSEFCREDPLAGLSPGRGGSVPTLGLLHADLDQPHSPYAPVSSAALQSHAVSLWLLGHIHAPRWERRAGCPDLLYPGSPQAMDPGERGLHGYWLAELIGSDVSLRQRTLSSIRYDALEVDLTGVEHREQFEGHLINRLRAHLADIEEDLAGVRRCVCQVTLTGRTRIFHDLPQLEWEARDLNLPVAGGMQVRIDEIQNNAQPAVDLRALSEQADVVGELARLMVSLENDADEALCQAMIRDAAAQISEINSLPAYAPVPAGAATLPGREAARTMLLRQSNRLLDALLRQKDCP